MNKWILRSDQMKKRRVFKVNTLPKKEKDIIKFMNDPKAMEKLMALGKVATSMKNTSDSITSKKFDDLLEWSLFSINNMSKTLLEESKEFQKEFELLITKHNLHKGKEN